MVDESGTVWVTTAEAADILGVVRPSLGMAKLEGHAIGLYRQEGRAIYWRRDDIDAIAELREAVPLVLPAACRVWAAMKSGGMDDFLEAYHHPLKDKRRAAA